MKVGDLYQGIVKWKSDSLGKKYPLDIGVCLILSTAELDYCTTLFNDKLLKVRYRDLIEKVNT